MSDTMDFLTALEAITTMLDAKEAETGRRYAAFRLDIRSKSNAPKFRIVNEGMYSDDDEEVARFDTPQEVLAWLNSPKQK